MGIFDFIKPNPSNFKEISLSVEEVDAARIFWKGWCIVCGEDYMGIKPNDRAKECDECEKNLVYGVDELLRMGVIKIRK